MPYSIVETVKGIIHKIHQYKKEEPVILILPDEDISHIFNILEKKDIVILDKLEQHLDDRTIQIDPESSVETLLLVLSGNYMRLDDEYTKDNPDFMSVADFFMDFSPKEFPRLKLDEIIMRSDLYLRLGSANTRIASILSKTVNTFVDAALAESIRYGEYALDNPEVSWIVKAVYDVKRKLAITGHYIITGGDILETLTFDQAYRETVINAMNEVRQIYKEDTFSIAIAIFNGYLSLLETYAKGITDPLLEELSEKIKKDHSPAK